MFSRNVSFMVMAAAGLPNLPNETTITQKSGLLTSCNSGQPSFFLVDMLVKMLSLDRQLCRNITQSRYESRRENQEILERCTNDFSPRT